MQYERLLAYAYGQPWAILLEKAAIVERVLSRISADEKASEEEIRAALEAKKAKQKSSRARVAVLPIYGTITQRADLFSDWSGGTSTEVLSAQVREALADPQIEAIVLDVDSPGGGVYGVEEAAQIIHAASKQKKVIAVANSMAASAAYWLASQATELVVSPGAEVGSIGVYMMHRDVSKSMETRGEKVTFVSAGERKTAGHPYGPLDDMSRAELQAGVDDYYRSFVRAVSRGRGVTQAAVKEGFGRGGMARSEQAVREGMADKIATLDEVLSRWGLSAAEVAQSVASAEQPDYEIEIRKRKLRM
jgi:capsid assembly protease